ncbi:MFS transporter [Brevibacillus choshinensis]|uniref:MFS transporter n=1 Tax=Brevibacillus choshinensis TaxID=54911 RepID=UPI002E1B6493|nr:MFS transporter [Brevibacillus choshinensis]MED4583984.1 MFS transporter [Brevibacillus choshinensis]MED4752233.1 MFS transporter [Brevibacillus choshinensis]
MREIKGKTQVIAVALVTAFCLLGDSMLYVVLPIYWQEAGLSSLWEVGILLSINRLVRVPLGPLVGKWYERAGGRIGLVVAVILAFLTTVSYGFHGFWIWLVMRSVWGIAWTFLRLGAYSLIVSVSEENNRGQLMGLYNGLYRLGSLGGMIAGALLASWLGLGTTAFILGCFSLPALALVFLYIRPSFQKRHVYTDAVRTTERFWKQKSVWATMATALVVAMVYQGMFASTLSRLIEIRQPVVWIGGLALGAAVMASLVQGARWGWEPWAAPWFGRLSDRYGRKSIFVWALLAAAVLFGVLHAPVSFSLWICILMGIQLTATVLTTVMDTLAADEATRQANSTALMTLYSVVTDVGAALGPLLAFWIDGRLGLDVMYVAIAVVLMLLAIIWGGQLQWHKKRSVL